MKKKSLLAAVVAALAGVPFAQAANQYWDTNGITAGSSNSTAGVWGTSDFWSSDATGQTATGAYVPGSDTFFSAGTNATGTNTIAVSGIQAANGITIEEGIVFFNSTASLAGGLSLGAGGVTLNNGVPTSGTVGFSTSLTGGILLTADQVWANNTTGGTSRTFTSNPFIRGDAVTGATRTLTFSAASGASFTIGDATNGGINDGTAGGNLAVIKSGAGAATLGGVNIYTGGTTINGGSVRFGTRADSVPTTGLILIKAGATLAAAGPATPAFNTAGAWINSGKIDLASAGVLALVAATDTSAVDLTTYPKLSLGAMATSTYSGSLTAGAEGYRLGGGGATLTVSIPLNQALPLIAMGTVSLSGNNTYSGSTTFNGTGGILIVSNTNALGSTAVGTTVSTGNMLAIDNGVVTPTNESVTISGAGVNSWGALSTNGVAGVAGTWSGTVTLNSTDARIGARADTTLTVTGGVKGSGSNQTLFFSGEAGTGTLILAAPAGSNTYTGPTNLVRGILKLGADNTLPTGTTLDLHTTGGTDASTVDLNGFNQTVARLQRSLATTPSTLTNSAGGAAKTLTINETGTAPNAFGGAADASTAFASIKGNLAINKAGVGTMTIGTSTALPDGTPNSYTGGTTVTGGTLIGTMDGAFGTGDVTVLSSGVSLSITGSNNTIADSAILRLAGGGTAATADVGYLNLGSSVNETVAGLFLNGVAQPDGTYGSLASAAAFKSDEYFAGTGILTVAVPEPTSLAALMGGIGLLLSRRRSRK